MRRFPPKETDAGKTSDEEAAEDGLCDKNAVGQNVSSILVSN